MRLILADDSVLLRQGLAKLLSEVDFEVIGQAGDAEQLLELVRMTLGLRSSRSVITAKRSR